MKNARKKTSALSGLNSQHPPETGWQSGLSLGFVATSGLITCRPFWPLLFILYRPPYYPLEATIVDNGFPPIFRPLECPTLLDESLSGAVRGFRISRFGVPNLRRIYDTKINQ